MIFNLRTSLSGKTQTDSLCNQEQPLHKWVNYSSPPHDFQPGGKEGKTRLDPSGLREETLQILLQILGTKSCSFVLRCVRDSVTTSLDDSMKVNVDESCLRFWSSSTEDEAQDLIFGSTGGLTDLVAPQMGNMRGTQPSPPPPPPRALHSIHNLGERPQASDKRPPGTRSFCCSDLRRTGEQLRFFIFHFLDNQNKDICVTVFSLELCCFSLQTSNQTLTTQLWF